MSFTTINKSGVFVPMIFCDQCEKPITDPSMAIVIFLSNPEDGEHVKTAHVHKMECDWAYTAKHGDVGGTTELDVHLAYLLNNLGLKGEKLKRANEVAAMLSQIG